MFIPRIFIPRTSSWSPSRTSPWWTSDSLQKRRYPRICSQVWMCFGDLTTMFTQTTTSLTINIPCHPPTTHKLGLFERVMNPPWSPNNLLIRPYFVWGGIRGGWACRFPGLIQSANWTASMYHHVITFISSMVNPEESVHLHKVTYI